MVLVLVVLSLTVLFPVRSIEVVGETRYTSEQIEQVSALKTGDNLLLADTDTAVSRILQQLPYIGEVSISRKLPGTLVIEAVEAGPAYALETDEQYLLINDKNKVVDSTLQKQAGLPLIRGMQIASAEKGGQVSFADADQAKLLQNLLERLKNQGLQITLIDLREPVQIRFVIDNRILVKFGSSTDMDKKLTHMIATYEKLEAGAAGTLDLTWWTSSKKDAYFKEETLSDEWLVPAASEGGEDPSAPNP